MLLLSSCHVCRLARVVVVQEEVVVEAYSLRSLQRRSQKLPRRRTTGRHVQQTAVRYCASLLHAHTPPAPCMAMKQLICPGKHAHSAKREQHTHCGSSSSTLCSHVISCVWERGTAAKAAVAGWLAGLPLSPSSHHLHAVRLSLQPLSAPGLCAFSANLLNRLPFCPPFPSSPLALSLSATLFLTDFLTDILKHALLCCPATLC